MRTTIKADFLSLKSFLPKIIVNKGITRDFRSLFVTYAYIYDNSVDDVEARLLFRLSNGQMKKMYVNDIPEWALTIL